MRGVFAMVSSAVALDPAYRPIEFLRHGASRRNGTTVSNIFESVAISSHRISNYNLIMT